MEESTQGRADAPVSTDDHDQLIHKADAEPLVFFEPNPDIEPATHSVDEAVQLYETQADFVAAMQAQIDEAALAIPISEDDPFVGETRRNLRALGVTGIAQDVEIRMRLLARTKE